jgi:signal transduction histidine kinase
MPISSEVDVVGSPDPYDHGMRAGVLRWGETEVAGVPASDLVVSALLLVVAVGTTLRMDTPEGPLALTLPVAAVMAVAVAARRRAPLMSLVVVLSAAEVQATLATSPGTLWSFAAFLLSAFSVARFAPEERAALGGGLVVGGLWLQEWQDGGSDYLFIALVFGGVWLLGRAVRRWQERATDAERTRDLAARHAVAEERVRIARELHDVVAHSLSVISVQANAAGAALDHDPALVREPLAAITTSAREALDEMRRMLSLLRTDEAPGGTEPRPGLAGLDALVGSLRAAGLPVSVAVRGEPRALPAGADVSAYRIVQEALTNVLKHAGPAPTTVEIGYGPGDVTVRVANEEPRGVSAGHAAGGGHGLVGIRERVLAFGGELAVGADGSGGFAVQARLPLGDPT